MPDQPFDSLASERHIDQVCDQYEAAWQNEATPTIESFLHGIPDTYRARLIEELIGLDIELRRSRGLVVSAEEYAARFPEVSRDKILGLLNKTDAFNQQKTFGLDATQVENDSKKNLLSEGRRPLKRVHYFGDYELLQMVARGGMGTVYRARQISLNRIVAIKMINSGQFASRDQIQRFYSEAEAAASLDHPHIIPVYEVGEHNGEHFFSMAFNEGMSLEGYLLEGPMEPMAAAKLMATVANAIEFAHDLGVIHRDIKPSNILLDQNARPRVSDFGLAKRIADSNNLTASGTVLGTPSFMPPEQAAGKMDAIDFTSDVYSLGAVLYACLSGRPPFQAASHLETLKQVVESEPVPLRQLNPSIPRDLETIVHKCLDKSMSRRYASPRHFADDLQRFRNGQPILARPVSVFERASRWCQRHPARAMNAAAAILIVSGTTIGWTLYQSHDRELRAQAKAAALVDQLNLASVDGLPFAVQQVRSNPISIKMIRSQYQSEPTGSQLRYRAAIGLLVSDSSVVGELCSALPRLSFKEWRYITQELTPWAAIADQWWSRRELNDTDKIADSQLLRIAATEAWLKSIDNSSAFEAQKQRQLNPNVEKDAHRIVNAILLELYRDPTQMVAAAEAIRPLRGALGQYLAKRIEYAQPNGVLDSSISAGLLARVFQDESAELFKLSWLAHGDALPLLLAGLTDSEELRQTLRRATREDIPGGNWDDQNLIRRKSAVAGLALAQFGEWDSVWPLLEHRPDPCSRSLLIEWLPRVINDPTVILQKITSFIDRRAEHLEQLAAKQDALAAVPNKWLFDPASSQLRACLQMLGNYPSESVNRLADNGFWDSITKRLKLDPDPGLHAVCAWVLARHQAQQITVLEPMKNHIAAAGSGWRTAANGHHMVLIQGPIDFFAGGNLNDPDRDAGKTIDPVDQSKDEWSEDHPHPKTIPRSFEIAALETQFKQMQEFDPEFHDRQNKALGPTLKHPACQTSWYRAAAYCNWLSEKENISRDQWCFLPLEDGTYEEGMSLAPDYLHRTGYRLPTEAEWEYACRAGTVTRRYFGETNELMNQRVWYINNSQEKTLQIPGTQLPNELGLFDTLGNVMEWCIDEFNLDTANSRFRKLDTEFGDIVVRETHSRRLRILRGSSFWSHPKDVRVSEYASFLPSYFEGNVGFRVARTIKN